MVLLAALAAVAQTSSFPCSTADSVPSRKCCEGRSYPCHS